MKTLFSLVESPFFPHFPNLYQELGIVAERFDSARNLHRALQKQAPDFFVGEFVYGWGNNYAGANLSNLDVTLRTLQCVAPQVKVIVFTQPSEEPHIGKLLELFPIHAVLKYPVSEDQMRAALSETKGHKQEPIDR
jgi:DNA-binding NarL/FixJ family response regulator